MKWAVAFVEYSLHFYIEFPPVITCIMTLTILHTLTFLLSLFYNLHLLFIIIFFIISLLEPSYFKTLWLACEANVSFPKAREARETKQHNKGKVGANPVYSPPFTFWPFSYSIPSHTSRYLGRETPASQATLKLMVLITWSQRLSELFCSQPPSSFPAPSSQLYQPEKIHLMQLHRLSDF